MVFLSRYVNDYNVIYPLVVIPMSDLLLCYIFSKKARWFQLHALTNLIIVNIIKNDVYNLTVYPFQTINILDNYYELYYIIVLHLYHFVFFNNTLMDYFHHSVFVLFGCIPVYYYYNYNIIRLATFTGCGLPGFIEYSLLTLVKHEKIKSLTQKKIMSKIYNYFRYPFGIFTISYIYIYSGLTQQNLLTTLYTMMIIYLNGAFYNKLTIENAIWHELSIRKK